MVLQPFHCDKHKDDASALFIVTNTKMVLQPFHCDKHKNGAAALLL
jgi:hypothetical protein